MSKVSNPPFKSKKSPLSGSNGEVYPGSTVQGMNALSDKPVTTASTTRWKEIADSVQRDIEEGRLTVGDLLPSETALTEKWKVSRMTAHRAMQELQRSGLVTRQRGRGTLVAGNTPKTTGNVALLFHNPFDLLEMEYMRGINQTLSEHYQILFCDSHADVEREARYLKRMQKEADGIIVMPSCDPDNSPVLKRIVESNFPIVCVDRVPENVEIDAVVTDNLSAAKEALDVLVQRGHKRIAHFTEDRMHISAVRERHQAFTETMKSLGETNPERLVRYFPIGVHKSFESMVQVMYDALFTLRHQPEPPTAVFCLNDYCLTVLLVAIERMGLKIPEDIEVLTFHDALTLMPSVTGSLHRIVQQPARMGQLAAERLKQLMENRELEPEILRVGAVTYSLQAEPPTPSRQLPANGTSTHQVINVASV